MYFKEQIGSKFLMNVKSHRDVQLKDAFWKTSCVMR